MEQPIGKAEGDQQELETVDDDAVEPTEEKVSPEDDKRAKRSAMLGDRTSRDIAFIQRQFFVSGRSLPWFRGFRAYVYSLRGDDSKRPVIYLIVSDIEKALRFIRRENGAKNVALDGEISWFDIPVVLIRYEMKKDVADVADGKDKYTLHVECTKYPKVPRKEGDEAGEAATYGDSPMALWGEAGRPVQLRWAVMDVPRIIIPTKGLIT